MLLGILLTLLVVVCVMLIAVILMQRSEGGALGMGGGGGGFLSTRGTADLLTRTTQWLGGIFFVLCLAITVITARTQGTGSLTDKIDMSKLSTNAVAPAQQQQQQQPDNGFAAPAPTIGGPPAAPAQQPLSSPFGAPAPAAAPSTIPAPATPPAK